MKRIIAILSIVGATAQAGTMTLIYTADNGNAVTGRVNIAQARAVAVVDKANSSGSAANKIMRTSKAALRDYWRSVITASEDSDRLKAAQDAANAGADKTDPTAGDK